MTCDICSLLSQLEEAAAESERQKLALKQQNTRQMQELVEQTSERLRRMETEYNAQSQNKVLNDLCTCTTV